MRIFTANWLGDERISSLARGGLLLLGHDLRLNRLKPLCLRSSLLAFALVLWLSFTLANLFALSYFLPVTWVTSLARPFSGLKGRKKDLGDRKLLR